MSRKKKPDAYCGIEPPLEAYETLMHHYTLTRECFIFFKGA